MATKKHVMVIALGACLVGLSAFGSLKHPVTRPIKGVVQETLVITLDGAGVPVSWEIPAGTGNLSHLGLVQNRGRGTFNPDGTPRGTGVFTAANGDQLFWDSPDGVATSFVGGTGRFAGATGSGVGVVELVFRPDPPPGKLVADVLIHSEGTITY